MSHTYCSALFHCVFSTKERRKSIAAEVQARLWAYMGGLAREHGTTALAVGGTEDHVHILLTLPPTLAMANVMREIKAASSWWMRHTAEKQDFEWQEGYGAFSLGQSQVSATIAYIGGQAEHHRTRSYEQEFVAILEKYQIAYDPRYVLG
jgi:REP element-mobilizing transposase RayT